MEPLRNLQRMEAKQNISFSEHTGTCWNLLGTCLVLGTRPWPNATFPNCNSHGTHWNLLEPLWNLQPAWAKLDFSFSEPAGTCPEYIYGFGHLVSAKHNFPENEIPMKPFGTCLNFCRTYSLRGPNSTSACRNLLEPARNLFGFEHLASAKRKFPKNPLRSEPTGTLWEPTYF